MFASYFSLQVLSFRWHFLLPKHQATNLLRNVCVHNRWCITNSTVSNRKNKTFIPKLQKKKKSLKFQKLLPGMQNSGPFVNMYNFTRLPWMSPTYFLFTYIPVSCLTVNIELWYWNPFLLKEKKTEKNVSQLNMILGFHLSLSLSFFCFAVPYLRESSSSP